MDLISMVIVGAVVSLVVQTIKKYAGTSEYETLASVIAVSVIAGIVYVFFKDSVWWQNFLEILVAAGAVYTYIIQRFEKPKTPSPSA